MDTINIIRIIENSIKTKKDFLENKANIELIEKIVSVIVDSYLKGGKVLLCGNGGSAADAQHIAAELSGRFYFDRPPLAAEAMNVNTSYITAVGNDYGYDKIYERYVESCGKKGDILIAISTSGNSENIINTIKKAKEIGLVSIGLTGISGGKMNDLCDYLIKVPSNDTPRIQETHILVGHIICELIEKNMFSK